MTKTTKRLPPTTHTVRELYLKSGNRCAFPGCEKALFKSSGKYSAQICHIEAAMPDGERFNKRQTNEQRRQPSNLMIMCYKHHIETNDVKAFPIERMVNIKKPHESKFLDIVGTIMKTVTDHTTLSEPTYAKNLSRLKQVLKWECSYEELAESISELEGLTKKLSKIPMPTREFF